MNTPATPPTAAQLSDPAHPAHTAFNWGRFFAILAVSLQIAAPLIEPNNAKVQAAITGATPLLGELSTAFVTAPLAT
jgi:hypothetical protein